MKRLWKLEQTERVNYTHSEIPNKSNRNLTPESKVLGIKCQFLSNICRFVPKL